MLRQPSRDRLAGGYIVHDEPLEPRAQPEPLLVALALAALKTTSSLAPPLVRAPEGRRAAGAWCRGPPHPPAI